MSVGDGPLIADRRLIEEVMGLGRLMRAASFPAHHASGLTAEQFWLLRSLEARSPANVGTVAEALGITPSSATSACKRLEQAGMVTRTRQSSDERVVQVDLTAQGRARLEEMRQRHRDAVGRLLAVLDPQEQAALQKLLERILTASAPLGGGHSCPAGRLQHIFAPSDQALGAAQRPAPTAQPSDTSPLQGSTL